MSDIDSYWNNITRKMSYFSNQLFFSFLLLGNVLNVLQPPLAFAPQLCSSIVDHLPLLRNDLVKGDFRITSRFQFRRICLVWFSGCLTSTTFGFAVQGPSSVFGDWIPNPLPFTIFPARRKSLVMVCKAVKSSVCCIRNDDCS